MTSKINANFELVLMIGVQVDVCRSAFYEEGSGGGSDFGWVVLELTALKQPGYFALFSMPFLRRSPSPTRKEGSIFTAPTLPLATPALSA
jgi:hypothetical protein